MAANDENLSESVFATLSERILRWDYLPGHRMTEDELCLEFGVSRSPVREALHKLSEDGLVERKPRHGWRVRKLEFRSIEELYDVRLALEEFALRRICGLAADREGLAALEAVWRELLEGLPGTAGRVPAADEEFHETLAGLLDNGALLESLRDIDRRIHFVRMNDIVNAERAKATCVEHLAILAALRAGDEEGALDALRRNIAEGRSAVEHAIKEALAHALRSGE